MAFAGLTADARILINRAQVECQSHKLSVEDPVTLEYITRYIAGLKQKYTQSNGRRPFGISCLIGGFDYDGQAHLYQTEPSGIYYEWKANATGRSAKTVREFLEKFYKPEEVESEDGAVKLAIKALLEVAQSGQKNLEVAVMERDKVNDIFCHFKVRFNQFRLFRIAPQNARRRNHRKIRHYYRKGEGRRGREEKTKEVEFGYFVIFNFSFYITPKFLVSIKTNLIKKKIGSQAFKSVLVVFIGKTPRKCLVKYKIVDKAGSKQ